jgi:3-phenylpropionate/cinnamic acid dioxygenase small subunit
MVSAGVGLEDVLALLADYGRAVDDRDLDALAALVVEDVVLRRVGGELTSRAAFVDFYRSVAAAGGRDHHAISNVAVVSRSERGTVVRSCFVNHRVRDDRTTIVYGRYEHVLVGDGRRALIKEMITTVTGSVAVAADAQIWTGAP